MSLGIAVYGLRVYYSVNELSKRLNQPNRKGFTMGIKAINAKIERAKDVNAAWAKLLNAFGDGQEFTKKQANEVLKNSGVAFNAIESYGGFKHVRTESFEIPYYHFYETSYVVYFNDTRFQFDYWCDAKRFSDTINNPNIIEETKKEAVEGKRYYYVLEDGFKYHNDAKECAKSQIKKLQKEMDILKKQLEQLEVLEKTLQK